MALDLNSILSDLREFIARNFLFSDKGYTYGDDVSFLENGIIDSLGIIELVTFVEKKYGISVADNELLPENFDSVAKLGSFVATKSAKGS
jgi:acyl carrier protein